MQADEKLYNTVFVFLLQLSCLFIDTKYVVRTVKSFPSTNISPTDLLIAKRNTFVSYRYIISYRYPLVVFFYKVISHRYLDEYHIILFSNILYNGLRCCLRTRRSLQYHHTSSVEIQIYLYYYCFERYVYNHE